MKTGSDLTEVQAFRNHTAHKQLYLLDRRKDVKGYVTSSVQSSGLPGEHEEKEGAVTFSVSSKCRGEQDSVVMEWFRRQPSARDGSCIEDVHSASHCLVGLGLFKYWRQV